jgi:hypothetical protein
MIIHGTVVRGLRSSINPRYMSVNIEASAIQRVRGIEKGAGSELSSCTDSGEMYIKVPFRYNRYECKFVSDPPGEIVTSYDVVEGATVSVELEPPRIYRPKPDSRSFSNESRPSWKAFQITVSK